MDTAYMSCFGSFEINLRISNIIIVNKPIIGVNTTNLFKLSNQCLNDTLTLLQS